MSFSHKSAVLALACALTGGTAAAKQVLDQPGAFQISLPEDFKVTRHGRGQTTGGSYVLNAESLAGNVKIFATSALQADPSVAFPAKFALWEARARKHRWYDSLKPVTGIIRGRSPIPTFFRSYDAVGTRRASKQTYRVLVMMSRHPQTRRLYTVAVASQADYFKANQARVMELAGAFQPLVVKPSKGIARGPVKKFSLRGRLVATNSGKVESRLPKAAPPRIAPRKDAPSQTGSSKQAPRHWRRPVQKAQGPAQHGSAAKGGSAADKPLFWRDSMPKPERVAGRDPEYVPAAKRAHVEGSIKVLIKISATGAVEDVRLVKTLPILGEACVAAIKRWRFAPYRFEGKPVRLILPRAFAFKL